MASLSLYSKLKKPRFEYPWLWLALFDMLCSGFYCAPEYLMIRLARTKLPDKLCSTGKDEKEKVILHLNMDDIDKRRQGSKLVSENNVQYR